MGEVYRARDTRLDRDVAIKILPEAVAADAERVARFQREAKVLASLNHPHIAAIYGLEDADGVKALVMELVEGEDLAQRLTRGVILLDEALPIATQIAEALEAAHAQGIIHRDLKPANIKLRPDGTVKVLDFGLAKALEPALTSADMAQSPTITSPAMTRMGAILGTAAYMSPEQTRGKPVDKRTDIWSFGCVLYEMLTGVRLFGGEDGTDSIAAIVRAEPDWRRLPPETPEAIRRLLRRCLEKDPNERLPDIAMARIEIREALAAPASEIATAPGALRPRRARLPWTVAALSIAMTLAVVAWSLRREASDTVPMRVEIVAPPGLSPESLVLSPDGRQLAFVAPVDGTPRVWVRRLDQTTAQPLPGTNDAHFPFWAPDGRAIGFFAAGKLRRIDLSGGSPQALADVTLGRGASWSRNGMIIYAPALEGGLMRVPADGGLPDVVTRLSAGQNNHRWPQFLPDGRHFFFSSLGDADHRGLFVGSLDGDTPVRILDTGGAAWYGSGYLVFDNGDVLSAAPFDVDRKKLTGNPVPVLQNPVGAGADVFRHGTGRIAMSGSSTGLLAYVQGSFGHRRLVWMDRAGKMVGTVGQPDDAALANPEISPDGRRVAVTRVVVNPDIWVIDLTRGVPTRFTFDPGNQTAPLWSPNGDRILFRSQVGGVQDLFVKPASGVQDVQVLFANRINKTATDWSPDGRIVLYAVPGDDLMGVDLESQQSFAVVQTSANEGWGEFSPDGRFVAYQSNESGRFEVYVRTFPGAEGKWTVSVAGGTQPRWSHDRRELYYLAPDGHLMAVPVEAGKSDRALDFGAAVPLFRANLVDAAAGGVVTLAAGPKQQYAVAADGRFLMNVPVADQATLTRISLVINWPALLKK